MSKKKTILIVEDEQSISDAICEGLSGLEGYDFYVEVVRSPEEYVKNKDYEKAYDLVIADLAIKESLSYWGLRIVLDRAQEYPGTRVIVYSAYSATENVVKAIRFGARDFISKQDCPPHEFVAFIEEYFKQEEDEYTLKKEREKLVSTNIEKWTKKYPSEFVVLIGNKIVAHGATRLEALLSYGEVSAKHEGWPEYPYVIQVQ